MVSKRILVTPTNHLKINEIWNFVTPSIRVNIIPLWNDIDVTGGSEPAESIFENEVISDLR